MTAKDRLLFEALKLALATYAETRRRTRADLVAALAELKTYLPHVIAQGVDDRTELVVKALIHLRKQDEQLALSTWMRRTHSASFRPAR